MRLIKVLLVFLNVALVAYDGECQEQKNLVLNSSFEKDINGDSLPDEWRREPATNCIWDGEIARTGKFSIKIRGTVESDGSPGSASWVSSLIALDPKKKYWLRLWVRGEDSNGFLGVKVTWFKDSGEIAGIFQPEEKYSYDYPGVSGWFKIKLEIIPATSMASIILSGEGNKGSFWFDDLSLVEEGEEKLRVPKIDSKPTNDFYFVQLTDTHIDAQEGEEYGIRNLEGLYACIREANNLLPRPKFIVVTGDLVQRGSDERNYHLYSAAIEESKLPVFNVFGNHDPDENPYDRILPLEKRGRINYLKYLGQPTYYSFGLGKYHFIVLDATLHEPEYHARIWPSQMEWLREDLRRCGRRNPIIIFVHQPMNRDLRGKWVTEWALGNIKELFELLRSYNVRVIATGHWHHNNEWDEDGIRVITTQALQGPGASYRLFHVYKDKINTFKRSFQPSIYIVKQKGGPYIFHAVPLLIKDKEELTACVLDLDEKITKMEYAVKEFNPEIITNHLTDQNQAKQYLSKEKLNWKRMKMSHEHIWATGKAEVDTSKLTKSYYIAFARAVTSSGKELYTDCNGMLYFKVAGVSDRTVNLLPDPGGEINIWDTPLGWNPSSGQPVICDSSTFHSGQYSLRPWGIQGEDNLECFSSEMIDIEPGKDYLLSGWLKYADNKEQPCLDFVGISLYCYDRDGMYIDEQVLSLPKIREKGTGKVADWHQVAVTVNFPARVRSVKVCGEMALKEMLSGYLPEVWFDDLYFGLKTEKP